MGISRLGDQSLLQLVEHLRRCRCFVVRFCCCGVFVVVLLLWCCCCGVFVVVLLLWFCFVLLLLWCGINIVVLLWCFCCDVVVVVLLLWCCCVMLFDVVL